MNVIAHVAELMPVVGIVAVKFNLHWLGGVILGLLITYAVWGMIKAVRTVFWHRRWLYVVCVRQADAWCWPEYLDRRMEAQCSICGAWIYYERKNRHYRKVCWQCREKVT